MGVAPTIGRGHPHTAVVLHRYYTRGMIAENPETLIGLTVVTDLSRADMETVHRWLTGDTYWGAGRSLEQTLTAGDHSLNFGLRDGDGALCGYARVVTDYAHFAWLADVYVLPALRGCGAGRRLIAAVIETLRRMELNLVLLATNDAHGFYEGFGFAPLADPGRFMAARLRPPR